MPFDSDSDLRDLLALYAAADRAFASPTVLTRPAPDKWSPMEHLHHVEMVHRGVLGALRFIETGRGNSAPVSPGAVAFLQQGVFPVRKAPPNVQPPDDLTAETATKLRRTNRERWASVRAGTLAAQTDTIPHPFLGPLSSGEWMRFALLHARHHHALAGIG